ncbi:hypothetical protein [Streptococcus thermophilus]|uniref:hypothetical protein n=1 Tax=Streptococcus thermophilus TaxID=1308 RepID=UPI0018E25391|nr:hypothetical protein [Streptococcus thermophilus]
MLFIVSSLMELFPLCELAGSRDIDDIIYNRGISGLNTEEFVQHIHSLLLDLRPTKVFSNIGTNDITEETLWKPVVPPYDGVHLYANAYLKVYESLKPYLLD